MSEQKIEIKFEDIPEFQRKQLVKATYEACKKFYSDPKNVERFEQWKAEKEKQANVQI